MSRVQFFREEHVRDLKNGFSQNSKNKFFKKIRIYTILLKKYYNTDNGKEDGLLLSKVYFGDYNKKYS